jgi:hypothetical protein
VRDYATFAGRVKAAAQPPLSWRVYGQQETPDGRERYDLLAVRIPASRPPPDAETRRRGDAEHLSLPLREGRGEVSPSPRPLRVLLNGGTHGDEPAGAEAVVRFLEARRYARWPGVAFTVLPCFNPWGYVHNRREGPGGADLNRSFRRAGAQAREVSLFKRALARLRFDLLVDCHEDVDAPGLYVFAPGALGEAIVEAAGRYGPLHPGPDVDGQIPLQGSVVAFDRRPAGEQRREFRPWWLGRYIARYHFHPSRNGVAAAEANPEVENVSPAAPEMLATALQSTVETPTCLPLDQRVAMHHAAIDAAVKVLTAGAWHT